MSNSEDHPLVNEIRHRMGISPDVGRETICEAASLNLIAYNPTDRETLISEVGRLTSDNDRSLRQRAQLIGLQRRLLNMHEKLNMAKR